MQLMKKWNMNWFMLCVAAVLITGCGNGGGFHTTGGSGGGGGGGGGGAGGIAGPETITVANNSQDKIAKVFIAPSSLGATSWGVLKNVGSPIPVGSTWNSGVLAPDTYDVRVESFYTVSTYSAEKYNFMLSATTPGATVPFVDADFSGSLEITNNGAAPITAINISATALGAGVTQSVPASIGSLTLWQVVDIPSGSYYVQVTRGGVVISAPGLVSISAYSVTPITFN